MYKIERLPGIIQLGHQGEHNAKIIEFDVADWLAQWPDAAIGITCTLPMSDTVVPAAGVTLDGNTLTWRVGGAITAIPGQGTVVIRAVLDDAEVRSVMTATFVGAGHQTGPEPEPIRDWINEAMDTLHSLDVAEQDRQERWGSVDVAVTEDAVAGGSVTQDELGTHFEIKVRRGAEGPRGADGADGVQGPKGDDGASITQAAFVGDDLVFTKDDAGTVTLVNAKPDLTGPQGIEGPQGPKGDDGGTWLSADNIPLDSGGTVGTRFAGIDAALAALANDIERWDQVQQIVKAWMGPTVFPVGTELLVEMDTYGMQPWQVLGHNHNKNPDDLSAPTMTIGMKYCIYNRQVSAPQMLWANTTGAPLPAGTYNLTLYKSEANQNGAQDGTYEFTISQPIPAGGGFMHAMIGSNNAVTGNHITTYDADGAVIESGLAFSVGSGGTALGTAAYEQANGVDLVGRFNASSRNYYGSNNVGESALRQWLNSDRAADAWWTRKTPFEMPPAYANVPGFLTLFDREFLDVLVDVDSVYASNNLYEEGGVLGGSYITRDKMFLPSMTELGLGLNNSVEEGGSFAFYNGTVNADRIKYDIAATNTARNYWVRSTLPTYVINVRSVNTSGALSSSSANNGYGAAPACVIG